VKHLFFFIRLLITKDFESGTGMNLDKWTQFADELSKCFEDILGAVQKTRDCSSGSDFEKLNESLARALRVCARYLNSARQLWTTLPAAPNKSKSHKNLCGYPPIRPFANLRIEKSDQASAPTLFSLLTASRFDALNSVAHVPVLTQILAF
jgi:hypothetical protein